MCMVDDAEMYYPFFEHTRTARKVYSCYECGRSIERGETYNAEGGKLDGRWDLFRTCVHCVAAREFLRRECNGWVFGFVSAELREHWDEDWLYRSIWLGRVIQGIRRKWRSRSGELLPVPAPYIRQKVAA